MSDKDDKDDAASTPNSEKEKLARLQRELQELKAQLEDSSKKSKNTRKANGGTSNRVKLEALQKEPEIITDDTEPKAKFLEERDPAMNPHTLEGKKLALHIRNLFPQYDPATGVKENDQARDYNFKHKGPPIII